MKVRVIVTPKKSILDPQGVAVKQAINQLGLSSIASARVGKVVDLEVNTANLPLAELEAKLHEIAQDLLSNPVVEDYFLEFPTE